MSAWLKPPKKELVFSYCPTLPEALLSLCCCIRQDFLIFLFNIFKGMYVNSGFQNNADGKIG